jgi:hypothetical protein
MIAEEVWGRSLARILRNGVLGALAAVASSAGAVAQTTAPLPPVVINSDAAANAVGNVPNPSGPPIPNAIPKAAGTAPMRPLQSAPTPAQAPAPQAATIGEIVAANIETPEKICPAVTLIITAEPGAAFDLIETARQRPKQAEGLAQCLSQIQSTMKSVNSDGAKTIDALVASAPAAFQAAYAVALANADSGDGGSTGGDAGGGTSSGGTTSGGAASGGTASGGSSGGGTGFGGFAGGGAIGGGGGGGNNGIPVSRSTP